MSTRTNKQWIRDVNTVSTFPSQDTFTKDAESIAQEMASKQVSPKGIGSGIRMIQFMINRAGKELPAERKRELEKAKHILQAQQKELKGTSSRRHSGQRTARTKETSHA